MKKTLCLALALLLLFGCAKAAPAAEPAPAASKLALRAENEILSYQKPDEQKTQIILSRTGNLEVRPLCRAFEEKNPDVQIVYLDITGGNQDYMPLVDWVKNGYTPDILVTASPFFDEALVPQYFENLSLSPVIQSYEAAALKRTAIADDIFWLPGPSNISAMLYNKTLFEQYGWEVPATFEEFLALCERIKKDTDGEVEPWNPNAKYSQELQIALEAFTYEELFGGAENRAWYNDVISGKGAFAGHMEPYYEVVQALAERGILRPEHYSYSATTRGKEFAAGKIAMVNMHIYDADNESFRYGIMPFPTTKGEIGYLCDSYSCFVGIPKQAHSEKEKDAIARFIAFFSSAEGQSAYIGKNLHVSNVKGVPLSAPEKLAALRPAIDEGHMFAVLDFSSHFGNSSAIRLHEHTAGIVSGERSVAECIALADETLAQAPAKAAAAPATAPAPAPAVLEKDATMLETSYLIADMYRETTGAQIGLIAHGLDYRGNLMRLFAGELTPGLITVLKPRSFANNSALLKLSMTGEQLLAALKDPVADGKPADCVYAASGLSCELAPWKPMGEKLVSAKLAAGEAIEKEKLYTVAAWEGTVPDVYITQTLERYGGSWEQHMSAWLRTRASVAPSVEARVKLVLE